ncbi:hypothetical protein K491DRAFT_686312 [Lophiostoma macrostomum CBS 122681]|uniref:N-acetyltransferase domain-containing protein n=1 Tax=Lophiostoma macrostomum CBS 122681 TaxID=1314788 RepID=A0A6A6TSJ2_9PLEO|nr:hypothetical protein K491DRAFT_686312 [Lophiostoma macrostomum CBS 122681]
MASPPDSKYTYTIHRIPTPSETTPATLAALVKKFKQTKLVALEAEPDGFAVKYADEVLHPLDIWTQRLAGLSTVLICVATPIEEAIPSSTSLSISNSNSTPESAAIQDPVTQDADTDADTEALLHNEWIGMATIRGPLPYPTYHLPETGQPIPADPDQETRWHLCSVYTSSAYRNRGLARQLCAAAIAHAVAATQMLNQSQSLSQFQSQSPSGSQSEPKDEAGKKTAARIRLFCNPEKTYLVAMYKRMGFKEAGRCTLKDAFGANGDGGLVPRDTGSSEALRYRWERRYGLAMERVCEM